MKTNLTENLTSQFSAPFVDAIIAYRDSGDLPAFCAALQALRPTCKKAEDVDELNAWIEQVIRVENLFDADEHLVEYWGDDPSWDFNVEILPDGSDIRWDNDTAHLSDGHTIRWESHLARWEVVD